MPPPSVMSASVFRAITTVGTLREALEPIAILVDECRFVVSSAGLSARAVDPANAASASLLLGPSGFESFACSGSEFGVSLKKLLEFLTMAEAPDTAAIDVDDAAKRLHLTLGGSRVALGLLDLNHVPPAPDFPAMAFPVQVRLPGPEFRSAVRFAEKVSDLLTVEVNGGTIVLEATGPTDRVVTEVPPTGATLKWVGKPERIRANYSLDYLTDMTKAIGNAPEVTIELGTDYPMKMKCGIAGGKGALEYLLAPRIEAGG